MPLNQPACTSQTATPALHVNRSRDVAQNSRRPGRPLLGGAPLPRMASSTFRCAATRCEAGAWSRGHVWPSPIAPRAHSGVSAHAVRLSPAFLCFCETRPRGHGVRHAAASALATLGQRTCTVGVGTLFFLVKFVYCIRSASSIARAGPVETATHHLPKYIKISPTLRRRQRAFEWSLALATETTHL